MSKIKPRLPEHTVTALWVRMRHIYGERWTRSYGDDPAHGAGLTWAQGLAGLSGDELACGLNRCVSSAEPWPPTLPEFRALCLDIPTLGQLRADIVGRKTRFAVLAWSFVDAYAYRVADKRAEDRMIREAYERAREHVMRGGALPPVLPAIAAPSDKPDPSRMNPERAREVREQLDAKLRASEPAEREIEPETDHGNEDAEAARDVGAAADDAAGASLDVS